MASGGRERPEQGVTDIDDLLARVRSLQKVLPELTRQRRAETDATARMGRSNTAAGSPPLGFSPPGRERDAFVAEPPFVRDRQQLVDDDDGFVRFATPLTTVLLTTRCRQ